MTIEQLSLCSASELEAMSDAELEQVLSPYYNVTRPDKVVMQKVTKTSRGKSTFDPIGKALAEKFLAAQFGLSLNELEDAD